MCNLFLNNIPRLEINDWPQIRRGGVLALHGAAASKSGIAQVSWDPSLTQNAAVGTDQDQRNTKNWQRSNIKQFPMEQFIDGSQIVHIFKIDCEGCEFSVIPGLEKPLSNKTLMRSLVGEYHLSLLDPHEETFAKKPSAASAAETLRILLGRGCKKEWQIRC